MIVVTGGAGFIGSNIVHALNAQGISNILVVDDLTDGTKCLNLVGAKISEYLDKDDFIVALAEGEFNGEVSAIVHQGACVDTLNHDGRMMMEHNYRYSLRLLDFCQEEEIPLIYASSAAVYGTSQQCDEDPRHERPLNVYGYSKALFDQKVRQLLPLRHAPIVGLRYFNVYGPREHHKGSMASIVHQLHQQLLHTGKVRLFGDHAGWGAGMQQRDFVSVDDVVQVNLHFLRHPHHSGIFNVGTGRASSFNDVALAVIRAFTQEPCTLEQAIERGLIDYIEFPLQLKASYQSHTQADLTLLRSADYLAEFSPVEHGIARYMAWLNA